jgi:hypothetical protein
MLAIWARGPVTKEALNAIDIAASRCYRGGCVEGSDVRAVGVPFDRSEWGLGEFR